MNNFTQDYSSIYLYANKIVGAMLNLFGQLWYFFLAGIIISALIVVIWPERKLAAFCQKLRTSSGISICLAALGGVISPIPTYATIPLLAALFKVGAPAPVLFTFLVSSPLMNPALFSLTLGAFGYQMAVGRLLVAIVLGIAAGYAMQFLISRNQLTGFIRSESKASGFSDSTSFLNQFYRLSKFAGKYLVFGITIAALVKVLIPASWVANLLGDRRSVSIPVAVAGGVPFYACGGAVIPVMQTLGDLGMNKGAILAFFISGPATKVSTLVALKAAMTRKTFILYLATVFTGALLFGFIYSIW
ncbi:permease [Candidatus Omnitrophota bacterium]